MPRRLAPHDITIVNEKLAFALAVESPVPYDGEERNGFSLDAEDTDGHKAFSDPIWVTANE